MKSSVTFLALLLGVGAGTARAEIAWANPNQEFQRTAEDRELTANFAFRNAGKTPVTIQKITTTCGCTTAELPKMTWQPGEAGTLPARFIFGGRRGAQAKSIMVATDDGKTAQLSFKCLILDDGVILSQSLVFWKVGDAAGEKQVDLQIGQPGKVKITAVASTNPRIAAMLATVREGEKYAVRIRPSDTKSAESGEVFVQTDFPAEGPKAYTIHVRVK